MLTLNQLKKVYTNSPLWLKNIYASIPYSIRNGSEYRKWNKFLKTEVNEEEYELLKFKETIFYAYNNTKFYKQVLDNLRADPEEINTYKDIEKLPIIDKEIVRNNFNDFLAVNYPNKKTFFVTTGGTSGTPMKYFQSKNIYAKELAFINSFFLKNSMHVGIKKASFRGIDFVNLSKKQFWLDNPVNNEIVFSAAHINEKTIEIYVNKLNELKIKYLYGFPSSMLFLLYNMKKKNIFLDYPLKGIYLISESFSQNDVDAIQNYFKCTVASYYGHSERLIFAISSQSKPFNYKVDRRYGLFELIDKNKIVITNNNNHGEIVGTSFDNYAMPLIRYKTGDFTEYVDYSNRIISLIQSPRNQEYVDCKDGSKIAFSSLIRVSEMDRLNILKYQLIQESPGNCVLLIIPGVNFHSDNIQVLRKSFDNRVRLILNYDIKIVDQLRTTKRGKHKYFIKDL